MKKQYSIAVSLVACMTIIISCNKEKITKSELDIPNSTSSLQSSFNELNYVGENHNALLDYVKDNLDLSQASKYDRYLEAKEFTQTMANWTEFQNQSATALNLSSQTGWGAQAVDQGYFPEELAPYLDSLEQIFEDAIDQNNDTFMEILTFENRINSLIDYIIEHEEYVYDSDTKTGNSVAKLVGALVLAKYSYAYWLNAALDEDNEWHDLLAPGVGGIYRVSACNFCKKAWRAIKVAGADVWGFMTCLECVGSDGWYDLIGAWHYAGEVSNDVP